MQRRQLLFNFRTTRKQCHKIKSFNNAQLSSLNDEIARAIGLFSQPTFVNEEEEEEEVRLTLKLASCVFSPAVFSRLQCSTRMRRNNEE